MARHLDLNLRGCLVWETTKPTVIDSRYSPDFYFQNCMCRFVFRYQSRAELYYLALLVQDNFGNKNCFPGCYITVCVKNRGESPRLSRTSYHRTSDYGRIWIVDESDILREVPDIFSSGTVRFWITIHEDAAQHTLRLQSVKDKSVQIGEEKTCQKNELNPCYQSLSKDLSKLLDEGGSKDVKLRCGDRAVSAHKVVLCTRSPVFSKMLESGMEEGRTGLVEIKDMQYDVLVVFLRYLYTGTLPELTTNTAMQLYEAGDKYEVQALMARCSHFLRENLAPENACEVLSLADAHSDRDFKEAIIVYLLDKKVPWMGEIWHNFCGSHPVLAIQVLNRFCNMFRPC